MKPLRLVFTAGFLGLAALAHATSYQVVQLDTLVHLTADQKTKAEEIFRQEETALNQARAEDHAVPIFKIVESALANVRAILTPDQLALYDRTSQQQGGGVLMASPEDRVRELDREVGLTGAQKPVALQVFTEEYQALLALPWDERSTTGAKYRQAAQDEIRAILTPPQLEKRDATRNAMLTRGNEELDATEKAVRNSSRLAAKIGEIAYLERGRRMSRNDSNGRQGQAQFKVTGANGTELVVVSWQRVPATGPVKVTKIAGADGTIFGP